ncbi:MAG TPA: hypothetical protein VGH15_05735 [Caulobacteraceae bacterium]|jgi:hypothetical protein
MNSARVIPLRAGAVTFPTPRLPIAASAIAAFRLGLLAARTPGPAAAPPFVNGEAFRRGLHLGRQLVAKPIVFFEPPRRPRRRWF